uniref:TNRC6 PABC binding domain-containing protein n=1 Tax=Oncorhynchus tshawytscha TaxID=74940 RepID=A0AAZ3PQN3_ONCTS
MPSNSAWSSSRASSHSGSLTSTTQSTTVRSGESKWSPGGCNSSLAHELWKVPLAPKGLSAPSRPPPGLTNQKPPPPWGEAPLRLGGWGHSDSRYTPGETACNRGCRCVKRCGGMCVCVGEMCVWGNVCV